MAIHRYFDENGFYWVHTPILTASDAEGAGELFRVSTLDLANLPRTPEGAIDYAQDFFGKPAFLTVSGQLNIESYCLALTNVYTFGPTFRAENSNTSRHLSEFWMVEPEIAFADISDNADLAEDLLKYSFRAILDECGDDMAFFAERIDKEAVTRLEGLVTSSFARMEYTEAIEILERSGRAWEFPVEWGVALQAEHERYLCEEYAKRPVVVVNYPKEIKAFYMRLNDDERTVAAMDVLAPGHRRDRGRQPARGAPRRAGCAHPRDGPRARRLLVVPRPAPVRHRAARRVRAGVRSGGGLRHGDGEHPRCHPVPAHAGQRRLLVDRVADRAWRRPGLRGEIDAAPARHGRRDALAASPGIVAGGATLAHGRALRTVPCGPSAVRMALGDPNGPVARPRSPPRMRRSPCSTRAGSPDRSWGAASVWRVR